MDVVREKLVERWIPEDVSRCLNVLVESGVLVEAATVVRQELRRNWLPQRMPAARGFTDLNTLECARQGHSPPTLSGAFLPKTPPSALTSLVMQRRNVRTFGEADLPLPAIEKILWSLYGFSARGASWIRTVPSASNLYQTSWYMSLLRSSNSYPRGFYEVKFGQNDVGDGVVQLLTIPGDADRSWETLLAPSILDHAQLVIYPVVDTKALELEYGNRAVTHALLEVGQSLQNGALAALEAGGSSAVCNDTLECAVLEVFGLSHSVLPLPALVVGAAPGPEQEALESSVSNKVNVRTVPPNPVGTNSLSRMSIAGPVALGRDSSSITWTSGRASSGRLASLKAEAEAWERMGWLSPRGLVDGRLRDFERALDPRSVVAYARFQYRPGFPFIPFDEAARHAWVDGADVRRGHAVKLPAQCVFALSSLSDSERRRPYANASTSGVAAWTTRERALTQAVMELVERDAFCRTWASRVAPSKIDEKGLSIDVIRRINVLRAAGFDIDLLSIPCKFLPVVAIHAQKTVCFFTCITTGAGFSVDEAVLSALAETETRIQGRSSRPANAAIRRNEVLSASDHGKYFQTRASVGKTAWILQGPRQQLGSTVSLPSSGEEVLQALWAAGHEVFSCDLTPKGASIGQGRTPLYVQRAVIPGLIPMWFGHHTTPWGTLKNQGFHSSPKLRQEIALHPCT